MRSTAPVRRISPLPDLYERGYAGATTAVIAQEAGATRGSIIFHFGARARLMNRPARSSYDPARLGRGDRSMQLFDGLFRAGAKAGAFRDRPGETD